MGQIGSSLAGPKGLGQSSIGNSILGYLFDPANISGAFGKNQGPGAFMNPTGQGGAAYPGGPGLPGGNATGGAANDVAAAIGGGELLGAAGAAGSGSGGGAGILSPGASGGGGVSGWLSNANPWSAGYGTGHALSADPALAGITPNMVIPGGSTMPAATGATAAAAAPASSGGSSALNNASQLASIAQSMGVGKGGGQQAPSQLAQPPPRTPVQQGAAPAPPVANPQPQSPGALSQPQAGNSPQLKQLLAQLGITANV